MTKTLCCIYICLCGLSCISIKSSAQYVLSGLVVTPQKNPVSNANIKLKDSEKGLPVSFAISDAKGGYRLKIPVKTKTCWIECSLIGYQTIIFPITIPPEDSVQHHLERNILIMPDTATLPEINVFSIPPITVSGDTTTFRVDAFKKGNETNVSDLLNVIPGFTVNNGRISYGGRSVTKVLIEDDDLFGNDYNTITQNLSPKGIEKIQLIENYNDKTYLSNRIQKGNELVVNLKFNRKYLYRIIATNEAGISINTSPTFYKVRQNIVSLIPRIKFVTTTNFNSTGLLASEVLGTGYNIPELSMLKKDGINFDLQSRYSLAPIEQIGDISSSIIPKNKMTDNHTSLVTTNGIYKASKKFLVKSIFQYYRDAYKQNQLQTTDYTVSGTNLVVNNTQFLKKQIPVVNASFENIYSPSSSTQFVYKTTYSTQDEKDSLDEFKQVVNTYTTFKNRSIRFQQQLGFSFATDSSQIIDIRALHLTETSKQLPLIYPSDLYKTLTLDSNQSSLIASSINTNHIGYTFQAKITTKRKKSNWAFELLYNSDNMQLGSSAGLIKKDTLKIIADNNFDNNAALSAHITDFVFSFNTAISKKFYFRTAQRLEAGSLFFNNRTGSEQEKSYTAYLPSYNMNLSLDQNRTLGLTMDLKSKLPGIYDPSNGNIFATGSSIIRGDSSLAYGISKTVSLSYSYAELIKRKLIWVVACFYSLEPVLYLAERNPEIFYTTSQKFIYGKDMKILAFTSNTSKYVSAIKSQINFDIQTSSFHDFYSTHNQTGSVDISNISPTIKCKTLVTGNLTASAMAKVSFLSQIFDKDLPVERKNTSQTFTYTSELVYHVNHTWIFNARHQYITQYQAGKKYSFQSGEIAIKYIAVKDKLSFLLSGNNIFNGNYFNTVSFSQNSINTQRIEIIRPYIMLHTNWEF